MTRPPAPLPGVLALAGHTGVVATGPDGRWVGTGPRAHVLEHLSPAAVAALDRLASGPAALGELLAVAVPGPERAELAALLGVLLRAGLLTDPDADDRVRRLHASALVTVHGDSALAVAVALALARAGIGRVQPRVTGRVGPDDVAAGIPATDAGRQRGPALRDVLRDTGAAVGPAGRTTPDLTVLTGPSGPAPDGSVEHLVVTLRNGRGVVGPLVLPGRGPCLHCPERPGDRVVPGPRTAAPHVVAATAALAAGQVLTALAGPVRGGPAPAAWAAELEVDPDAATITPSAVRTRPGCPCGGSPGSTAVCTRTAEGWTIMV